MADIPLRVTGQYGDDVVRQEILLGRGGASAFCIAIMIYQHTDTHLVSTEFRDYTMGVHTVERSTCS